MRTPRISCCVGVDVGEGRGSISHLTWSASMHSSLLPGEGGAGSLHLVDRYGVVLSPIVVQKVKVYWGVGPERVG